MPKTKLKDLHTLIYDKQGQPLSLLTDDRSIIRIMSEQEFEEHIAELEAQKEINLDDYSKKNQNLKFSNIENIIKKLDKHVYGQETAKKKLALALKHVEQRINFPEIELEKNNILILGDTGCGKSFLIENLSNITGLPLIKTFMSGISTTGVIGDSFENIFYDLIDDYNNDENEDFEDEMINFLPPITKENSEYALVHIDEIDKISKKNTNSSSIFDESLQNELIRYIEDSYVLNGELSTKNMTFIGTGRFYGLEEIISKRINRKHSIGFSAPIKKTSDIKKDDILSQTQPEDLINYGFSPELVGRFPIICSLKSLTENNLVNILNLQTSYLSKKRQMFKKAYNINLRFTASAKQSIATFAKNTKTNARGLMTATEKILEPIECNITKYQGSTIVLTKDKIYNSLYKN